MTNAIVCYLSFRCAFVARVLILRLVYRYWISFCQCTVDGLCRWLLINQLCQHSRGLPLAVVHPLMERTFPFKTAVLLAQDPLVENLERPVFSFSAHWLNRSSEQQRKPKHRPLHQAQSSPLSWLFAVLGSVPVHSHRLLGCRGFSLSLCLLEQRSSLTTQTSKALDVLLKHQLSSEECFLLMRLNLSFLLCLL